MTSYRFFYKVKEAQIKEEQAKKRKVGRRLYWQQDVVAGDGEGTIACRKEDGITVWW